MGRVCGAGPPASTAPPSAGGTGLARRKRTLSTPAEVWKALTDPAQLREWAPFDSDRNLGAVGSARLTTVGAPTPHVTETRVKRADPLKALEYTWGGKDVRWELEPPSGFHP